MKQAQLKISVHIHTIKLKVRFPCSITASLRVGKPPIYPEQEEVSYGQDCPLRMGEAII
jgi:hypothetical protein